MNHDLTPLEVHIDQRFLFSGTLPPGHPPSRPGALIAVASVEGQVLYFWVILRNGALWRLPINAISMKPPMGKEPIDVHRQVWDCFPGKIQVIEFKALAGCEVRFRTEGGDDPPRDGEYLFTIDFVDYDNVGDWGWKCAHVIADTETGGLVALPNNWILWDVKCWVTEEFKPEGWKPLWRKWSVG